MRILVLLAMTLLMSGSAAIAQSGDTTNGYVVYTFNGGGCGLSEHDAPNGMYLHIDIREFYRWNVGCVSTAGGYASSGWPATGRKNLSKYLAFQVIPEPGYTVRLIPGGLSFKVRSDVGGPDSLDVILETAFQPLRTIMTTSATSELRTVQGVSQAFVIGGPTLVRMHAWRSDSVPGGIANGSFFIDDVSMSFQIYPTSTTGVSADGDRGPESMQLSVYPNPFNPETVIRYEVAQERHVRVVVYDALGRSVDVLDDRSVRPGSHAVRWNASGRPTGSYVVRLETGVGVVSRKLLLVR